MHVVFLYTDFGLDGPYVGQLRAAIAREAPALHVVDLCHDVAPFDARAAAYLLAALVPELPEACAIVGVVDPGVGTDRQALVVEAGGRTFVGPDNGLFGPAARAAASARWRRLTWRPERLSRSFHGRDLFAPAAARLLCGHPPDTVPLQGDPAGADWPEHHEAVIYIDRYGNAMTGIPARHVPRDRAIEIGGAAVRHAPTFAAVPRGAAFWYENANGLVEIAVNQGRADAALAIEVGTPVRIR